MDLGPGIRDPGSGKSLFRIPGSKRHRIPDPDPQHWGKHAISFPQVKAQLQLRHFHFWAPRGTESLRCPYYTAISSHASTEVLALALLSTAAVFIRSCRAAVALSAAENEAASAAAATGTAAARSTAAAGTAAVDTAVAVPAATCRAALGTAATCTAAAGRTAANCVAAVGTAAASVAAVGTVATCLAAS